MVMWNWFIAPLGLPRLNYWQSVGLSLFISFLHEDADGAKKMDEVTTWYTLRRSVFYSVVKPSVFLLVGWLVHFAVHKS